MVPQEETRAADLTERLAAMESVGEAERDRLQAEPAERGEEVASLGDAGVALGEREEVARLSVILADRDGGRAAGRGAPQRALGA